MIELYLNISLTILIYITLIIKTLLHTNKTTINKETIKRWFDSCVTIIKTSKITRTSDLFISYQKYMNINKTTKQDLILFGRLFKTFIKEECIPVEYKKNTFAGYTNIKNI